MLLQDGSIHDPDEELLRAASDLSGLGVIAIEISCYVKCVNERDRDYRFLRDKACQGKIHIEYGLDEDGNDFRCPDCNRTVRPFSNKKRQFKLLRTRVIPEGVKKFVYERLSCCEIGYKEVCGFVCRIDAGQNGGWVCVVDYCGDEQYLARDWASFNPTCYVYVDEQCCEDRFLNEDWIVRVPLTAILCGSLNLADVATRTAQAGRPKDVKRVSPSVYSIGARPIAFEPVEPANKGRSFVLEIHDDRVSIGGKTILTCKAKAQMSIFRILLDQFCEDLKAGLESDQYHPLNVDKIADVLNEGKNPDNKDLEAARRAVNRLQESIETAVKKNIGLPIDRMDIIQTVNLSDEKTTDHGYRLNPFTVILRPLVSTKK